MKKTTILFLLFLFMTVSSVQALSWAYPFVVWEGKVYEVKQEEIIEKSEIGKIIGEVKTKPDEISGDYYGDASNYYPIGTIYYEIEGISTSTAIAVTEDKKWVKAVFVHEAPFHIMNILSSPWFVSSILIIVVAIGVIVFKKVKRQRGV